MKHNCNRSPEFHSGTKLTAKKPLQLVRMDLFPYNSNRYLTLMDIYSKYAEVIPVPSQKTEAILNAYRAFCFKFAEPDNAPEFTLLPTYRSTTPAYHPQANGSIERFHKEVGVMSRIHHTTPNPAVQHLRDNRFEALFFSGLKLKWSGEYNNQFSFLRNLRHYEPLDMVWRLIPLKTRAKHTETFTGPDNCTSVQKLSDTTYSIPSHKNDNRILIPTDIDELMHNGLGEV